VHEPNVSDRPHLATADPRYSAEVSEENVDLACRISAALAGGFEAVEPSSRRLSRFYISRISTL
jgi:hypothetical protein